MKTGTGFGTEGPAAQTCGVMGGLARLPVANLDTKRHLPKARRLFKSKWLWMRRRVWVGEAAPLVGAKRTWT